MGAVIGIVIFIWILWESYRLGYALVRTND